MSELALKPDHRIADRGGPTRVTRARQNRGRMADLSGRFAEESVARLLEGRGLQILHQRWRGKAGEIDMILRDGNCFVFVEVKQSRSHEEAAGRLLRSQQIRICNAALEFCATQPEGLNSEMRFDAALVDSLGRIDILENAFGDCFA
ncbi:YraN family protein [Paracoccus sp. 11-3]|uniref:UPF0102 protein H4P12_10935 n=2 Tax=Paracoccus amoyensis TaxID=2760093 RepID=A0A926GES5_9RHOB|nr:YraN family protein [Paracoccus amoyensis]